MPAIRQTHSIESVRIMRRSKTQLSPLVIGKIRGYLLSQFSEEGGFLDRAGKSDLYYTLFGFFCSAVMDVAVPLGRIEKYLNGFDPGKLSMVHLTCLVKCRVLLEFLKGSTVTGKNAESYAAAMEKFQTAEGAFSYDGRGKGFPYASFMALNFYQDLKLEIPRGGKLLDAMYSYRTQDGSFRNPEGNMRGMLLSTVASLQVIRYLTGNVDDGALKWLKKQCRSMGGFSSSPEIPIPDMLSTGVALFTLAVCGTPMDEWREGSRKFIDDHWDDSGAFRATVLDDICDSEYTYYGLLALGALYADENDRS